MSTDIMRTPKDADAELTALDRFIVTRDLAPLHPRQRLAVIREMCSASGLDIRLHPWDFLKTDDGRVVPYLNAVGARALGRTHQLRYQIIRAEETDDDLYVVTVRATAPNGRSDEASKYVPLTRWDREQRAYVRLTGQKLGDAKMKAETGAKRRVTLSMTGGVAELADAEAGRPVYLDGAGNLIEQPSDEQRALIDDPRRAKALGRPTWDTADADAGTELQPGGPTEAELEPVRSSVPRQSFKPSDEDVKRWQGGFFATVKGTSLDNDEDRHHLVADWTAKLGWSARKQTDSITTMFHRMTEDEAQRFLNHVKAMTAAEKGEYTRPDRAPDDDIETPF